MTTLVEVAMALSTVATLWLKASADDAGNCLFGGYSEYVCGWGGCVARWFCF
jgi:hypothetical protein